MGSFKTLQEMYSVSWLFLILTFYTSNLNIWMWHLFMFILVCNVPQLDRVKSISVVLWNKWNIFHICVTVILNCCDTKCTVSNIIQITECPPFIPCNHWCYLPIFNVTVMMFSDMVESVILLNDEAYKQTNQTMVTSSSSTCNTNTERYQLLTYGYCQG